MKHTQPFAFRKWKKILKIWAILYNWANTDQMETGFSLNESLKKLEIRLADSKILPFARYLWPKLLKPIFEKNYFLKNYTFLLFFNVFVNRK